MWGLRGTEMLTRLEVRYETEAQVDPVAQAKLSRLVREFIVRYLEIENLPPLWTAVDILERGELHRVSCED